MPSLSQWQMEYIKVCRMWMSPRPSLVFVMNTMWHAHLAAGVPLHTHRFLCTHLLGSWLYSALQAIPTSRQNRKWFWVQPWSEVIELLSSPLCGSGSVWGRGASIRNEAQKQEAVCHASGKEVNAQPTAGHRSYVSNNAVSPPITTLHLCSN